MLQFHMYIDLHVIYVYFYLFLANNIMQVEKKTKKFSACLRSIYVFFFIIEEYVGTKKKEKRNVHEF